MRPEEIKDLAKKHGIEIKLETLQINDSGLDFIVGLGTDTMGMAWILRVPRRKDAVKAAEVEKRLLEAVKSEVLAEVPVWIIFHEELIAYPQLTGKPAGTIDPKTQSYQWEIDVENVPESFHRTLARAMVSLHQINDSARWKEAGITVEQVVELSSSMRRRMEKVKQEYEIHPERWDRWQQWLNTEEMWPPFTGLVHGDLHAGHIMVDKDANVTGFIDWTEAKITDTSIDFTAHYMTFGESGLDKLLTCYEEFGGKTWTRMKDHILMRADAFSIDVAEFAARSSLKEYKEMAEKELKSPPA
ncbi:macrolide 2'-phosphotransferase [Alkalicoccus daliensis]|uniref:Macrolide phosphotransferase n=1 Tax=Alkalicoccus daliensis TaxID=745820 RepID=A0A1H0HRU9_9BACI|nr:macrolide 2'-phosphotransferase [Alkalicoccus daliensis]SDO21896.1 macrolide phosphotransferase [Alkalicoccus daliensis]